jgi:Right handed beta helix region
MRRIALLAIAAGFLTPLLASAPASAQATRTWVSGVGDDVNPCSRTAPCKTFAGAISKTATAGEINCLDPGGFGTITITKSMTLNCHEVLGSILASGVPGVTINSTAAGSKVILRGLQINGVQGGTAVAGTIGVRIIAATTVAIEDTVITQFAQQGIIDSRTGGGTKLFLENVTISHNVGTGISLNGASVNNVMLDNVYVLDNALGLAAATGNNAAAKRSVFSGNAGAGVEADPGGQITVDNSMISNNGIGLQVGGTIKVSNSDIVFNTNAFSGAVITYGNNRITGNIGNLPTAAGSASNDIGQQ